MAINKINGINFNQIDSYTKLLINFDGIDGANTYTAETGQTVTFAGTAQLDTDQKKFGTASLLLDGNSDYVTVPDSDDWHFGTGDFTIDFWVNFHDLSVTNFLFAQRKDSSNHHSFSISSAGVITYYCRTGGIDRALYVRSAPVFTQTGIWYHVTLVRNGSSLNLYINGTRYSINETTAIGDLGNIDAVFTIGANGAETGFCSAYIDAFRISKGIARWTENFNVSDVAPGLIDIAKVNNIAI